MPCPSAEQLARLAEGSTDAAGIAHAETCTTCRDVMRIVRAAGSDDPPAIAKDSIAPGDTIGRYVVLRAVAQGGMGEVYLGYDPVLDRNLALKLVRADRNSAGFASRLAREGQVLAKLAHSNVVRVFDAGTWRGLGYVAMEYLDGESVRTWCASGKRSASDIVRVFIGAAHGIEAAHHVGVVHRDIKPDNILVGGDGVGRIADFGLVADIPHSEPSDAPAPGLTDGRSAVGTLGYRAPELVAGGIADARSDQWSLCAALCEMLLGVLPTPDAVIPSAPRLPAGVVRALRRGLDPDPGRRFASTRELAVALERRPRLARYVAGAAVVTIAIATAVTWTARDRDPLAHCDGIGRSAVTAASALQGEPFGRRFGVFGTAAVLRRAAIDRELRSYTTRLAASAVGACRAERVNPAAAALQRDCVADRRRELAALVTVLQGADRTGLEQASNAIAKLPDPALCDDPGRLATIVPIEPAARSEADRITGEVAALRSRWLVGERGSLVPPARSLADRAERLGAATVALSTSGLLADLLSDRGELTAASEVHLTAAGHAARAHDDRSLALRLIRAAETAAAAIALERASALLAAAELVANRVGDRAIQDDLDVARAELAIQRGNGAEAVPLCRAVVARLRERHGGTSPDSLNALYELARALFDAKQFDDAREVARTTLAEITAIHGDDHPDTVPFHHHLAKIASELGHHDEARQELERELAITRAAYGEDSPLVADTASNLAALFVQLDRNEQAAELGKQAVAIGERHGSRKQYVYLAQLALAYLQMGNAKQGVPLMQRSLALREELFGAESPELIKPLTALGLAAANADDLVAARRHWGRAVTIMTQLPTPPASGVDLMRDLASILDDRRAKQQMLADADALERRLAARAKLASKP